MFETKPKEKLEPWKEQYIKDYMFGNLAYPQMDLGIVIAISNSILQKRTPPENISLISENFPDVADVIYKRMLVTHRAHNVRRRVKRESAERIIDGFPSRSIKIIYEMLGKLQKTEEFMSTTGMAKELQRIIEEDKVEVRFVKRVFEVALEALKSQECLDLVARMKKIYKSGEYKITWRLIFLAKFSKYHRERIERIYENADIIRGIRAEIFSKVVEHVANKVENELDTYGIPKAKLAELLLLFSTIK